MLRLERHEFSKKVKEIKGTPKSVKIEGKVVYVVLEDGKEHAIHEHEGIKWDIGQLELYLQAYLEGLKIVDFLENLGIKCCGIPMEAEEGRYGVPTLGMKGGSLGGGLGDMLGGLFGEGGSNYGYPLAVLVCAKCGHFRFYARNVILEQMKIESPVK